MISGAAGVVTLDVMEHVLAAGWEVVRAAPIARLKHTRRVGVCTAEAMAMFCAT